LGNASISVQPSAPQITAVIAITSISIRRWRRFFSSRICAIAARSSNRPFGLLLLMLCALHAVVPTASWTHANPLFSPMIAAMLAYQ
jgi:hypothetical protein